MPEDQDRSSAQDARQRTAHKPRLLVLDTAHTLEMVRERQLEKSVTSRDLGGFFDHVWSVHPFATMLTSDAWGPRYGQPQVHAFAPRHTMIQGTVGRFAALKRVFPVNFLLGQWTLFRMLNKLIRRERIDAIRAASPLYLGLFGLLLARRHRIPLVIRVGANHDKTFAVTGRPMEPRLMRSRRLEKLVERFVFPRADLVAGANQDNLDFALANGARPERSTLFRYGNLIDDRHLVDPAERVLDPGIPTRLGTASGKYLFYVGRLEPVKQPDHVVRALAAARAAGHDVKALLAGDGSMRDDLARLAGELGVADHLLMPGNLGQADLAQLLAQAAVIVSPHTGRALNESALAAAPIVAYAIDWQAELIEDRVTGRLVPHDDVAGLGAAVADLLADPAEARRLGRAARAKALDMLDPAALDAHERDQYRKLLAERR